MIETETKSYQRLKRVTESIETDLRVEGFADDFYSELKGYAHLCGFTSDADMKRWALPLCEESLRQWSVDNE